METSLVRIILFLMLFALLMSCATNQPTVRTPVTTAEHALNHNKASVYIAIFYCEKNRWPNDLMELTSLKLTYRQRKMINDEVSWGGFTHLKAHPFSNSITLYSPEKSPGVYIVKSDHWVPNCEQGVFVKSKIYLG